MDWLEWIISLWPFIATVASIISAAILLWLRSQFVTKTDLDGIEKRLAAKIDAHEQRLDTGSDKMSDLNTRVAIIEEDCESTPSKADLNQAMAVLSGRISGMESGMRGVESALRTQHDYLRTLVERGLK